MQATSHDDTQNFGYLPLFDDDDKQYQLNNYTLHDAHLTIENQLVVSPNADVDSRGCSLIADDNNNETVTSRGSITRQSPSQSPVSDIDNDGYSLVADNNNDIHQHHRLQNTFNDHHQMDGSSGNQRVLSPSEILLYSTSTNIDRDGYSLIANIDNDGYSLIVDSLDDIHRHAEGGNRDIRQSAVVQNDTDNYGYSEIMNNVSNSDSLHQVNDNHFFSNDTSGNLSLPQRNIRLPLDHVASIHANVHQDRRRSEDVDIDSVLISSCKTTSHSYSR